MAQQDLFNLVKPLIALDTQLINTDTTTAGNIIDMEGFESLLFAISTFLAVVGVVTFLCGLVCLRSSRRRPAARS